MKYQRQLPFVIPHKKDLLIIAVSSILLISLYGCTEKTTNPTININSGTSGRDYFLPDEYYPPYETVYFTSGKGYEIKNENSDKLLITLDGGPGWISAIGQAGAKTGGRFFDIILPLHEEYNIFIPEKFNWVVGAYYLNNFNAREQYTADNLLANYVGVIREYLSQGNYSDVIIIGSSEGAMLLPEIYLQLEELDKISALISVAGGGLSRIEQSEIMYNKIQAEEEPFIRPFFDLQRLREFEAVYEMYREEPYPDSSERMGLVTTRWLTSTMFRRPFDFYVDIDIPVLFIHGEMDSNALVESTRYVEENLPYKPFDYIYYPRMRHTPLLDELLVFRADLADWLREKGL